MIYIVFNKKCYATDERPPSTPKIWPVTQELSSLNKNLAIEEESLPSPIFSLDAF